MGIDATKPVLWVSDKATLKPVSSATEYSQKIEISLVASLDIILSKKGITDCADVQAGLRVCCSGENRRQVFLRQGPFKCMHYALKKMYKCT